MLRVSIILPDFELHYPVSDDRERGSSEYHRGLEFSVLIPMKLNRNLEFLELCCLIGESNTIEGKDGNISLELHGPLDQLFVRQKIWK